MYPETDLETVVITKDFLSKIKIPETWEKKSKRFLKILPPQMTNQIILINRIIFNPLMYFWIVFSLICYNYFRNKIKLNDLGSIGRLAFFMTENLD